MPLLRSALISLSRNRTLRRACEHAGLGARLSARFVAGHEIADALRIGQSLNQQGMTATLDSLGESVTQGAEAHQAAEVYHQLLDSIAAHGLRANISLKLTQMGLDLSPNLAESIVEGLARHARKNGCFVRVDMEGSNLTQVTLDIVRRIHARPDSRGAIGVVIQAYLYRSQADIEQLLVDGIPVRLCKGAYKESADVAFPHKADVDANFIRLSQMLLSSSVYNALATHDEHMIEAAKSYAKENGITPGQFEFQMLYGIRRDLQRELVRQEYRVRIYVPFGHEWYPYFMRRLAERPANLLFLARNLFRS